MSKVARMSEALWVPDLELERQSACSLVSAFSFINSLLVQELITSVNFDIEHYMFFLNKPSIM